MPGQPSPTFAALGLMERGLAVALARLGVKKAAVNGVLAPQAREGGLGWGDLDAEQRATPPETAADLIFAPLAAGIEALHPSWAREAMVGEPTGLALALAEDAPDCIRQAVAALVRERGEWGTAAWTLGPGALSDLRRLVFAPLETLTTAADGPLGADLSDLSPPALLEEIARWGARTIGASLAGAPLELRAHAMAVAGAPWANEIAVAAARPLDGALREQARASVARAVASLPAPTSLHRLRAVGVLVLARALAGEGAGSARRVAGRLPIELGRALLATC